MSVGAQLFCGGAVILWGRSYLVLGSSAEKVRSPVAHLALFTALS